MDDVTPIPTAAGNQVAILGTSNWFCNSDGSTSSTTANFVSETNAWLAQGGIVVVTQDACASLAQGAATYTTGTAANNNWNAFLDAQVVLFKKINGTVIWRPFAEFNGTGHFGSQFTPEQFQQFWIYTYNYMHAQGVNNVLYAFDLNDWDRQNNTAACGNTFCTGANWYPGNAYVDLTAMDSYPPGENGTTYDTVMYNYFVSTGKPFFFFEAGVSGSPSVNSGNNDTGVLNVVESEFPKAFAVVIWCQTWALDSQNGESAVMRDPAIVTLSDVPAAFANGSSTP
jgi:hypothetical protein